MQQFVSHHLVHRFNFERKLRTKCSSEGHPQQVASVDLSFCRCKTMDDVLCIPELLEHILFHLTPSDQLNCRGVCLNFRNTIDRSPRIRKAMFRDADLQNANPRALPYRINCISFCLSTRCEKTILKIYVFPRYDKNVRLAELSFLKSLLIAQPPPKWAKISTQCSCAHIRLPEWFRASSEWLNLGEVLHMVKEYGRCSNCDYTLWEIAAELPCNGHPSVEQD